MKKIVRVLLFVVLVIGLLRLLTSGEETAGRPKTAEWKVDDWPKEETPGDRRVRKWVNSMQVPVEFHGRVVDCRGVGLKGAMIRYKVIGGSVETGGGVKEERETREVASDERGFFRIDEHQGMKLVIGPIRCEGYREGYAEGVAFSYSGSAEIYFQDPERSEEFMLSREDEGNPEMVFQRFLGLRWNQGETRCEIPEIQECLILRASREKGEDGVETKTWELEIACGRGELQEMSSWRTGVAPAAGYRRSYRYGPEEGRGSMLQRIYALRTAEGRYAMASLVIRTDRDDANGRCLQVMVWSNPQGSRLVYETPVSRR